MRIKQLILSIIIFIFSCNNVYARPGGCTYADPFEFAPEAAKVPTKLLFKAGPGYPIFFSCKRIADCLYQNGAVYCVGSIYTDRFYGGALFKYYNFDYMSQEYKKVDPTIYSLDFRWSNDKTKLNYLQEDSKDYSLIYKEEGDVDEHEYTGIGKGYNGQILVADRKANKVIFFKNDLVVRSFSLPVRSGVRKINQYGKIINWMKPEPLDVAQSLINRKIYVTDARNMIIEVFDANGNHLESIDEVEGAEWIAIDSKGDIFLAGRSLELAKFSKDHSQLDIFEVYWKGIATGLCLDSLDRVFVCSCCGDFNVFDNNGNLLHYLTNEIGKFSVASLSDVNSSAQGLAISNDGRLYYGAGGSMDVLVGVQILDGPNQPPVFEDLGDKTVSIGQVLRFQLSATDPDGDPLTYSVYYKPIGARYDPLTRWFSYAPTIHDRETRLATFVVIDGKGGTDYRTIKINVLDNNQ